MRLKGKSVHRPSPLTPMNLMTIEQLPQYLATAQTNISHLKTSIPIKQYSNKFFRQTDYRHKIVSVGEPVKSAQQKRFNTLMRKKQMLSKHTLKYEAKGPIQKYEEGRSSMITIKGYCSKAKKRSVTEIEPSSTYQNFHQAATHVENAESTITQLQQELVISSSLFASNLLSPSCSSLLRHHTQAAADAGVKQKTEPSSKEEREKISQSRGLQLFSKLFVKDNKSAMVEKPKESHRKFKKNMALSKELHCQTENSFQTKKIYPMEKSRKKEQILKSFESRRKGVRTPMRTIDNHFTSSIGQTISHQALDGQFNEPFQIRGWDTTL